MSTVLKSNPTPQEFASQWSVQFGKALSKVAKDGKVDEAAGETLQERKDELQVFGDNVVRYMHFSGQDEIETQKMLDAGKKYALQQAEKVAGPDGKVSDEEALKMGTDLIADFYILRGKKVEATIPKAKAADVDAVLKAVYNEGDYSSFGTNPGATSKLAWPIRKCVEDYDAIWAPDYPSQVSTFEAGGKSYYLVNQQNEGGGGMDVYNAAGTWMLGVYCSESGDPRWSLAVGKLTDEKLKALGLA